ncbi:MAG: hypothetical protein S0880_30575 [Actinomycetota bacterium]|nr:hypothetical protein [Actinomycetota bacterium]
MTAPGSGGEPLVVTVVYLGPADAGTSTMIRSLASTLGEPITSTTTEQSGAAPGDASGAPSTLEWLEHTGGAFEGRRLRCQVVAVPGHTGDERWEAVVRTADAVVAVVDATADLVDAATWFDGLRDALGRGRRTPEVVIAANKADLDGAATEEQLRATIDSGDAAIVETSAHTGAGVRQAFVFAVRASVRALRGAAGPERPERLDLTSLMADASAPESQPPRGRGGGRDAEPEPLRDGVHTPTARPLAPALGATATWSPDPSADVLAAANADEELGRALLTTGAEIVRTGGWLVRRTSASSFELVRRRFDELVRLLEPVRTVLSDRAVSVADDGRSGVLFEVVRRQRSLADALGEATNDPDPSRALATLADAATRLRGIGATTSCPALRISLSTVAEDPSGPWYVGLCEQDDDTRSDALTIGAAAQRIIDRYDREVLVRALEAQGLADTAHAWGLVSRPPAGDPT